MAEEDLADRYAQALNELDQQHWQQAAEMLAAIEQERPGYRDVAALLTTVQHYFAAAKAEAPQRAAPPAQPPPTPASQTTKPMLMALWGVVVGFGVIATILVLVFANRDSGTGSVTTPNTGSTPNTGPFTGRFTADFGPETMLSGQPWKGATPAKPATATWELRSMCRPSGCAATASARGQVTYNTNWVFDDVGGHWLAVAVSPGKCKDRETESWEVITLQPHPDGTLSGEWTVTDPAGCSDKRTVTFTRTGDADIDSLPDPAIQPPRVVSPAEALHGRYHSTKSFVSGVTYEADFGVRTDCLRNGERCTSFFYNPDKGYEALLFENGSWTRNEEWDGDCPAGGTSHVKVTAQYPLPQPPQDPITLLTGHGHQEETGACTSSDFDQNYARTGD
ncbi:hypothetical protein [Mycobacterium sp.]|uniref:hypothetical protein n=1 Tax=Mycobacterium sp. TaxID=1785 RepID=UPI002CA410B8|nr:hypothetical protein [Mycobacterium sp.]HTY31280.1 hypothetical protein [Mycobacterium sp.]